MYVSHGVINLRGHNKYDNHQQLNDTPSNQTNCKRFDVSIHMYGDTIFPR
jgi:hypothetical protein